MALASLKYSLGSSAIKQWDSVQKNFYEKVWKNEEKFYTYVGVFCGALILIGLFLIIAFSGAAGGSSAVKFDPYQVMGLDRNCTDKEVKSQFRRLSRTMHPDRNTEDEPEVAKQKYLQIKESQDILLNAKRRKNFDEHGDPDWVDLFDYETYPDILMNPGKPFVLYTTLLAVLFGAVLPLAFFILHPALEDPPEWLTELIFDSIKKAENDLSNENLDSSLENLKQADELWNSLIKSFPAYRKSVWCVLIEIRIACRRAQCQLFKASNLKPNTKEFQDLIKETTQMMKTTKDLNNTVLKTSQTRKETFAVIQPYLKDVKNMIDNTDLRGNIRELETLLTTF